MKKLRAFWLFFLLPVIGWCQTEHFLYLQTDNKQPFYVKYNNKIYSSSQSGHVIVGKLPDTPTISIIVGFPKNLYDEQLFYVPMKSDMGFLLKYYGDKNWSLFNFQTLTAIKNSSTAPPTSSSSEKTGGTSVNGTRKNDRFSLMLASAVNDTSILYAVADIPEPDENAMAKNKPMPQEEAPKEKTDSSLKAETAVKTKELPKDQAKTLTPVQPEIIKKDTNIVVKEAVAISEPSPSKKDTSKEVKTNTISESITNPLRKDSSVVIATPVIEEPKAPSVFISGPVRISKEAEILTDTSYIAVFVDTLANGFDTIRVSIPFDETKIMSQNYASKSKEKTIDTPLEKTTIEVSNTDPIKVDTSLPKDTSLAKVDTSKNKKTPITTAAVAAANKKVTTPKKTTIAPPSVKDKSIVKKPTDSTSKAVAPLAVNKATQKTNVVEKTKQIPNKTTPINLPNISSTREDGPSDAVAIKPAKEVKAPTIPEPVKEPLKKDTVKAPVKEITKETVKETTKDTVKKDPAKEAITKETTKDASPIKQEPITKQEPSKVDTAATTRKKPFAINSDCKIYASENDVDKLRIKLLAEATDDDKLATARKIFKQRCFSSRHIKALSELFSSDEGKYRWLDASYPYVSDPSSFDIIRDVLKDPYFINRFNAMIRHE